MGLQEEADLLDQVKEEDACECIWQTDPRSLEVGALFGESSFRFVCKALAWLMLLVTIFEQPSPFVSHDDSTAVQVVLDILEGCVSLFFLWICIQKIACTWANRALWFRSSEAWWTFAMMVCLVINAAGFAHTHNLNYANSERRSEAAANECLNPKH